MNYDVIQKDLKTQAKCWLITGVAGFIGSHLLESLLLMGQIVTGLDNFSSGLRDNLKDVRRTVGEELWSNFTFIEGDICDLATCKQACVGIDYILHQAALGSVPRSIEQPLMFHEVNINGFLNMLLAARDAHVKNFVFASSSSVYGDSLYQPRQEDEIGNFLSPYALTKFANEAYAKLFAKVYGHSFIGLRYFNVYGKRQNPNGVYAAVIPKWIEAMMSNHDVIINGDDQIYRDFCFIEDVVQANILAALSTKNSSLNKVYNVGCQQSTTLRELFSLIRTLLEKNNYIYLKKPKFGEERIGDIKRSIASIELIQKELGYFPNYYIHQGLEQLISWILIKKDVSHRCKQERLFNLAY